MTVYGETFVIADLTPAPRPQRPRRPQGPYRRLFAAPGSLAFTLAGALGRLPISMLGVATVVMVATLRDSWALAGAVSATGLATAAACMPFVGRLVDRHGQARVAVPATVISTLGAAALLLCAHYGAPDWTLFVGCAVSSVRPSLGAMTRARWNALHREDEAARHTANSVEQVIDELCFMAGPVLAVVLCGALFPEAGMLVATVLFAVGTLLFAAQRRTEPPVEPRTAGGPRVVNAQLLAVLAVFFFTGCVFGSIEVVTVADVQRLGDGGAAGVVLALQAGGSCAAGLAFGLLRVRGAAARRFVVCTGAMALCLLPLTLAGDSLVLLSVLLVVAGMATAPTMVTGMTLVQEAVPGHRINEGMTTVYTGLLIGISAGAALGGTAVESLGPATSFWLPVLGGALAFLTASACLRRLPAART